MSRPRVLRATISRCRIKTQEQDRPVTFSNCVALRSRSIRLHPALLCGAIVARQPCHPTSVAKRQLGKRIALSVIRRVRLRRKPPVVVLRTGPTKLVSPEQSRQAAVVDTDAWACQEYKLNGPVVMQLIAT